jgi:hypothetical protein
VKENISRPDSDVKQYKVIPRDDDGLNFKSQSLRAACRYYVECLYTEANFTLKYTESISTLVQPYKKKQTTLKSVMKNPEQFCKSPTFHLNCEIRRQMPVEFAAI